MRFLIVVICSIAFYSCRQGIDPFDYSKSFLHLVDSCNADIEYLNKQIDRMGLQLKANTRIDSSLFKASLATIIGLSRKFAIMTDSLARADAYDGDDRIKKKTIELLGSYNREILPAYTAYITAHYNVYGKNDIRILEKPAQDSLHQIIISASERMINAMDRHLNESESIKRFIYNWIQAFKNRSTTTTACFRRSLFRSGAISFPVHSSSSWA